MNHTLAILLVGAVLTSCTARQDPQSPSGPYPETDITLTPAQEQHAGVRTVTADTVSFASAIECRGIVSVPPGSAVQIPALIGGTVATLAVIPGQRVAKGDVIATLEGPQFIDLQRDYLATGVELELAERQAWRQERLSTDTIVARKSLDDAQATARLLRIRQQALVRQLALIGIEAATLTEHTMVRRVPVRCSINGVVTAVAGTVGRTMAPGAAIADVVDASHCHLELTIYERDAATVRVGTAVHYSLTSGGEQGIARVLTVGGHVSDSRTVVVHAEPIDNVARLVPGSSLTASIDAGSRPRLAVPRSAIQYAGRGTRVAVQIGPGRYRWIGVDVGHQRDSLVEVVRSVTPLTHPIVTSGHRALAR
ncbi:MAG: efflux RND transporter periplasmic adaptor subunit [Candidatus Kapabacteria bacterium]|jgi:cobalt-zinc-cadmium efflux system membrane fusion protein|nr:efflux RND transporter periplasmic adaptor subunit [Candidatus Kapabacteria bacterium]